MNNSGDDEWEYEYNENEMDEFYFTLDLSGILPTGHESIDPAYIPSLERRRKIGRPSYKKTKSKAPSTPSSQQRDRTPDLVSPGNAHATDSDRIQVLDLHTSNPLIGYQGHLLSCHWASTVGTDMLFAKSEQSSDAEHHPLCTLPSFGLLALSSTRLMASTAQLRSRDDLPVIEKEFHVLPGEAIGRTCSDTTSVSGAKALLSTSRAKINQMDFLSRLNAASLKRKRDAETTTTLPAGSTEDLSR